MSLSTSIATVRVENEPRITIRMIVIVMNREYSFVVIAIDKKSAIIIAAIAIIR